MPIERVKITSNNITLKNANSNVIFNTDFKYIKTDVTGNLAYSVLTPSINVDFIGSSNGLTMPLSEAINKRTGVVFYSIVGDATYLWNYPEDIYLTTKIPANGNLIFPYYAPALLRTGVSGGSTVFNYILYLYQVYANTRFLGYYCVNYVGTYSSSYPIIHPSGITGASIIGTMRSAINIDNAYRIYTMPVYKNEVIRFYRPTVHLPPVTGLTWSGYTGSGFDTISIFLYNSGTDTIPLKVTS